MSKNVICDKEHKGCIIPKKVLSKLLKITAGVVIATTELTPFSGCQTLKKGIEDTTIVPSTTKVVEEDEDTKNEYDKIVIEEESFETEYPSEEDYEIEYSTEGSDYENESIHGPIEKKADYDILLSQLNNKISNMELSVEAKKMVSDTFHRLYNNYPTWKNYYKDLPSRAQYIKTNFIDVFDMIDQIDFIDEDSKEGKDLIDEGTPFGWVECDEKDNLTIKIIAQKADKANSYDRCYSIEQFFHEVIHCKQKDIMLYYSDYFDQDKNIEQLFIEGGASFHMKFTNPVVYDVGAGWSIGNNKENLFINYTNANGNGYLLDLNGYEKLAYLVGYNTLNKVEKGVVPLSVVEGTIAQKYGQDKAEKFLNTMESWYVKYNNNWKGDSVYNTAIELENLFLDFLQTDINSLKNKEEFENFTKIYNHYKNKNLPSAVDHLDNDLTDRTFNIKETDKLLENKAKSLGINIDMEDIELDY